MDVQNAKAKLSRALTDIKANFKPDDGAVGVKKIRGFRHKCGSLCGVTMAL